MTTFADVAEGVRAAVAAYAQAIDDGRTDDVVALFCADASVDIPGVGTPSGTDALREGFAKVKPRGPQRHLVVNTVVTEWSADEARAVSDLVVLGGRDGTWSVVVVGRYDDVLHRDGDRWRFHHRSLQFS